jgi:hypothetical protein
MSADELSVTDSLAWSLEHRIAQFEQITAARWPRRWLLRTRYARQLRASTRHVSGRTWLDKRTETVTTDWLAR